MFVLAWCQAKEVAGHVKERAKRLSVKGWQQNVQACKKKKKEMRGAFVPEEKEQGKFTLRCCLNYTFSTFNPGKTFRRGVVLVPWLG